MNQEQGTNKIEKKKYSVVLADPPWDIQQMGNYGAKNHYELMTLREIEGLGAAIREITEDNAHLWLWVTNATIPYMSEILDAWGFTYRSILTWCKPRFQLGVYLRNATEQVIFATKGKAPVGFKSQPTWQFWPIQEHSHKPEELYAIIERVSGKLNISEEDFRKNSDLRNNKLELFARRKTPGWDVWGNEIDSDVSLKKWGYMVPSDEEEEKDDGTK
jgi:N6-adenosine-specific RNA methylase IME4